MGVDLGRAPVVVGIGVGLNWVVDVLVLEGWKWVFEDGVGSGCGFSVVICNFESCGEER